MEIRFANNKVRKLCEKKKAAERELGTVGTRILHRRLRMLEAAVSLQDVAEASGGFHPLINDRKGQYALKLHKGWRLVFSPRFTAENEHLESKWNDPAVWAEITIVRIEEIVDYH